MEVSDNIRKLAAIAMSDVAPQFARIDETAQINTEKVLKSFQQFRVSGNCFDGTTGYGYNDKGRDTLDSIYADVFGTESAIVRAGFVNGTHAITAMLFAAVRPGQTLFSATGTPYDTLCGVIGISGEYRGSLKDYGIAYSQAELTADGKPDYDAIARAVREDGSIGAVFVQRSRGYSARPALTVAEIGQIVEIAHAVNLPVVVDNCYGEFTEIAEPGAVGADLIAGSLIKNPGGGIAPMGGYVAGRSELVEAAAFRLTAPGIGAECGATLSVNRAFYQGFFMAPHVVAQAMKTAVFAARLFELMGCKTAPASTEARSDIIQTIEFNSPEQIKQFCRGIQAGAPVDSYVTPEPWDMPGYDCQVIMAAGAFIQGASIELSADGPMRPPYRVYMQGGITFESGKLGVMLAASMIQ